MDISGDIIEDKNSDREVASMKIPVLERLSESKLEDTVISSVLESVDTSIIDNTEVVSGTTILEEIIPDVDGVISRVDGTSWYEVSDTEITVLVEDVVDDVPGLAEKLDDMVIEGDMVAVGVIL